MCIFPFFGVKPTISVEIDVKKRKDFKVKQPFFFFFYYKVAFYYKLNTEMELNIVFKCDMTI